eukprot:TRINITY_DN11269_c0_g1_i1.p1 TRINITY_DN11269_c0_g1~~TRINITY_DN11269_c0_g1_i1.p1  ORF type:complete len:611 (+),score=104.13 TRINITY_DN11269_c0_g1_i1:52-1884(+)
MGFPRSKAASTTAVLIPRSTSNAKGALRAPRRAVPLFPQPLPVTFSLFSRPSSCSRALPTSRAEGWSFNATRWYSGEADAEDVETVSSTRLQDPFTARLFETLQSEGPYAAVRKAFSELGSYRGNEVAWQNVTDILCHTPEGASRSVPHLRDLEMKELLELTRLLIQQVELTQASFWENLTEGSKKTFQADSVTLNEIIELAGLYTQVGAWEREVFRAALVKVAREVAVHWMEPNDLANLLEIFSRAGSASREISGLATRLFNELEERVLEDGHKFAVNDCISIIGSMARFSTRDNELVLRHFGREKLHPNILELPGPQIAQICNSYGALGWKHDTVFKQIMTAMLDEQDKLQRARILGTAASGAQDPIKYTASEIALVAMSLVNLRMYRGNNDWYRWGDNYEELLDVLVRRISSKTELEKMGAKPLAAAAFVLGRARRGTEDLCNALLARMIQLLEAGQANTAVEDASKKYREAPQEHLELFMHGIAMMGPSKRKEFLDTQWLREWMCMNYYTLSLQDLIRINRHLVQIRSFDQPYLETFVPLYCEPENMDQLKKSEIMDLTHTYNGAKLTDEDVGRHFFWALGRQFQKQHVEGLSSRSKKRPPVQRYG